MSMRRWITTVVSLALVAALVPVAAFVQPQVAEAAAKPTVTVTRATTGAVTMKVGSTYKLKAKASSGAALTYKSSKKKVVTVTKKGVLKAKKVGKATVTVTAKKGSKTAKKKIKVTVVKAKKYKKATSITVKAKKKTLTVGETTTLSVTFNPKKASNKNLIFKSANPKIASVDEQGNVTALKGGRSARILVTSCDNAKAKKWVEILVNEARVTPAEDFEYAVGDFIYEGTVCTGDVDNLPPTLVDEDCLSATVFRDEYGTSFTAQGVKAPALSLEERLQEDYSGRISGGANGSQSPSGGRLTTYDCGYGVYITGYTGTDGNIVIPDKIDGVEVVGVCLEHYVNEVNYYESVDLSRCSSLKAFECVGSVGKLNFGSSSSLVDIWLGYGSFGVLDFSSLPNLEKLVLGTGVGYSSWVMGDKVKCLELWLPGDVSFGQKSELESLTVYGAPASILSEVHSLPKLRKLTLSGRGEAYSEELTFSYNPLLTYLSLSGYSGISQIDISCNQELQSLDLGDIDISQLYFPQASQLRDLALRECASIESLDFSGCSLLENLSIKYCDNLSDVTVSGLPSLKSLEYSSNAEAENPLRSLNANDCVMLEAVDITAREGLQQINLNGCVSLKEASVTYSDALTSLSMQGCTSLEKLDCSDNSLQVLNLKGCESLREFDCSGNQLASLSLGEHPGLLLLHCSNNQLSSIDLSCVPQLLDLSCSDNQLTSLDVSFCPGLVGLDCADNNLAMLNISSCSKLLGLDCSNNALTTVDLRDAVLLRDLSCRSNDIDSLDLSANRQLERVRCDAVLAESFDTGLYANLEYLNRWL